MPQARANAIERLVARFTRNGYVRVPQEARKGEGHKKYKKGWEVRLVFASEAELEEAQRSLRATGMRYGQSFLKGKQWIQPIYGKKAVEAFGAWVEGRREADS